MRRLIVWLLIPAAGALGSIPPAVAQLYPKHHPVAGGIAVIELSVDAKKEVNARFGRTPILTTKYKEVWFGVVGVDLETAQGNYLITVSVDDEDPTTKKFEVQPYGQPLEAQRTLVTESNSCNPSGGWRAQLDVTFPMIVPVSSKKIIPFATRYTIPEDSDPERGIVFRLSANQNVLAPGEGILIDVSKTRDEGPYHVKIDHGMGLYSCLGPVSSVFKEKGESVGKGETIGETYFDQTRSQGLYWKTKLNDALVNPLLFTKPMETDNE